MTGGVSEEEKLRILYDNNNQINKMLKVNAKDKNENIEYLKNKRWVEREINHSRIALEFKGHDFRMDRQ